MNKVILMGRLTRDPEVRYASGDNLAIARYTLANQKRQTNWLTDYHANYKKKLEEHRNAVISEAEKEKTD